MTLFICEEHWTVYLDKVPKRVRRATQELLKRTKSVVIVGKETCQVCAGLLERDFAPVFLCEEHLRAYYHMQVDAGNAVLLKDPSFTLKFIRPPGTLEEERLECVYCKTGKYPE